MIITVSRIETLRNSYTGAPRFKLHAEDGSYITSSNESFCWGLMNGWKSYHDQNGRNAEVELTRAGRIRYLRWIPSVTCADMHKARARLERARDARMGHLGDTPQAQEFDHTLKLYDQMLKVHRSETGCEQFH